MHRLRHRTHRCLGHAPGGRFAGHRTTGVRPMSEQRNLKVRIRFSKLGKIRFTSHRDVARIWERALRRAALPVAYTEGFSPHPKLSFGLALSTGHESLGEYLDVDLAGGQRQPEAQLGMRGESLCVGHRKGGPSQRALPDASDVTMAGEADLPQL